MAVLYISEFSNGASVIGTALVAMMPQPSITDQTVAISGSSAQSAAFNARTRAVLLSADAICSIAFGANPTATATNLRLPANTIIAFAVVPGQKVAVISNT